MKHEESNIQQAFIQWCELHKHKYPELGFMHHSPNGGRRSAKEGARFKREGVKAGFPDLLLAVARNEFHGLFIEVKTKKGRLTASQEKWKKFLIKEGYSHNICRTIDECINITKRYLNIQ